MAHYGVALQIEINKITAQMRMNLAKSAMAGKTNLMRVFSQMDNDNSKYLDHEEFEKGLAAMGLFPTKVQLQTLFKYFDASGDGRISYNEFLNALREPLDGRREEIVKRAWCLFDPHNSGLTCAMDLASRFNGDFSQSQFARIVNAGHVTKDDFFQLYTDISMGCEDTNQFCGLVQETWNFYSGFASSEVKDMVKKMTSIIRQRLLSLSGKQSDEYMLRTIFNEFDTNKNGKLSADELHQMLIKLQISCDTVHLRELLNQFDRNGNGVVEFEEFLHFIIHNPYK